MKTMSELSHLLSGSVHYPRPNHFPAIDHFIKDSGWAGNFPRGSWSSSKDTNYVALCGNDDREKVGRYTLDSRIPDLPSELQVGYLKAIATDQIPEWVLKKGTRAAVVEWALDQGYIPADLRAEAYIYTNLEGAKIATRALDTGNEKKGQSWTWFYFSGSTVRGDGGAMYFPCLGYDGVRMYRGGSSLRDPWGRDDVLLVFEF